MFGPRTKGRLRGLALAAIAAVAVGRAGPPDGREKPAATTAALQLGASPAVKAYARAPVKWAAVLDRLSPHNVFRLVFKAKGLLADKKALTPEESARLAAYVADGDRAYEIQARRKKGLQLTGDDEAALDKIQAKYASARQELYEALMKTPELSGAARVAFNDAIKVATEQQKLQLRPVE